MPARPRPHLGQGIRNMVLRLFDDCPPDGASRKIVIPKSHATRDLLLFLTTIRLCLSQCQGTAFYPEARSAAVPQKAQEFLWL